VKEIKKDGNLNCWKLKKQSIESLFKTPIDSKLFNMCFIPHLNEQIFDPVIVKKENLQRQMLVVPFKRGYAMISLLHDL